VPVVNVITLHLQKSLITGLKVGVGIGMKACLGKKMENCLCLDTFATEISCGVGGWGVGLWEKVMGSGSGPAVVCLLEGDYA
jgi:hypothetical protein